jgi:chloride channel protein, CIC family
VTPPPGPEPEAGAAGGSAAVAPPPRDAWHRLLEAQRRVPPVLLWSAVVGAIAGAVGGGYRVVLGAIAAQRATLEGLPLPAALGWLVPVGLSAALVAASLWLVRRFAPETSGSGVQEIEGALDGLRPLRWRRVLPVKLVGGLLALGSGLVLGREGPTIQMGGASGRMVSDLARLDADDAHALVAAGAGAGLAAAFSAPFAGILFVVEEMRPQFRYSIPSLQTVVIACAVADIVVRVVAGSRLAVPMRPLAAAADSTLWLFPLLGALYGLLGVLFNAALLSSIDVMRRRRRSAVLDGLTVGGLIGLLGWWAPVLVGDGHPVLERALAGGFTAGAALLLLTLRLGTTVASYASGAPGGIFAPMLALGGLLGTAFGELAQRAGAGADPALFAVAGLGALFAASVRAPLTGMMLAMELTGAFDQVLPLMLTCATSTLVAHFLGGPPVYTALLRRALADDRSDR